MAKKTTPVSPAKGKAPAKTAKPTAKAKPEKQTVAPVMEDAILPEEQATELPPIEQIDPMVESALSGDGIPVELIERLRDIGEAHIAVEASEEVVTSEPEETLDPLTDEEPEDSAEEFHVIEGTIALPEDAEVEVTQELPESDDVVVVPPEAITAYVTPDEIPLEVQIDPANEMPDRDFMVEYLTSKELDPNKRINLLLYITKLDDDALAALWQSFKRTYGADVTTITAFDMVQTLVKNVEESKSLKLRNKAAEAELHRMGTVYAQLARALKMESSDVPLNAMRTDELAHVIRRLNKDLTTMNAAIIEMAQMLLIDGIDGDAPDMAIDPRRAAKICAIVGYSAKSWAKVHEHAEKQQAKAAMEIATLKTTLETSRELAANAQAQLTAEIRRIDALTVSADAFTIRNHSGNFIATTNKPEEGFIYRLSPINLCITQNKDEALVIEDIETARKVYDAIMVWGARNYRVRRVLGEAGVNPSTLFIATDSVIKVS